MLIFLLVCLTFALVGIVWTFIELNRDNDESEK